MVLASVEKQFCKRKIYLSCQEKKGLISRINVAEKQYMVFVGVCKMLTEERYWPAAEQRADTN
jgi:hypothetical protein